ncbi:MAG: hypothetical protein M3Q47_11260 [Actinomycetota bacterium]|nr:hypothetical protein [Actinomycetota bacterium]
MTSSMSTLTPAGPRGPVGLGLPTAACAVDPAVVACWRALPAVAVAARPRPGTRVFGVLGIDVFVTPAFDAHGISGYAQRAGKRTATEHNGTEHNGTEHNGTTLGLHSPRRPSS